MGEFSRVTSLSGGDGEYHVEIDRNWCVWSPAGGYLMALTLAAAGHATEWPLPISLSCHLLAAPKLARVDLRVRSLRRTRVAESLRVSMTQEERPILEALVWTGDAFEGYGHDDARMPEVPGPEGLESAPSGPGRPGFQTLWQHLEHRPLGPRHWERDAPGEPRQRDWLRLRDFDPEPCAFADAGRMAIFLDSYTWPAAAHAHSGDSRFVAPTVSFSIEFHRRSPSPWILSDAWSPVADEGRIATCNRLFAPAGELLASASGTLLCRPRPGAPG